MKFTKTIRSCFYCGEVLRVYFARLKMRLSNTSYSIEPALITHHVLIQPSICVSLIVLQFLAEEQRLKTHVRNLVFKTILTGRIRAVFYSPLLSQGTSKTCREFSFVFSYYTTHSSFSITFCSRSMVSHREQRLVGNCKIPVNTSKIPFPLGNSVIFHRMCHKAGNSSVVDLEWLHFHDNYTHIST